MDFQSIAKVSPKGHLPEELCRDILSRLPVKSLLRFCCASKSWLSLIKDPDFHRLHLQNFKNNHDETHLLVIEGDSQDCVVRCSNTFEKLLTLEKKYGKETINCCIDGLVLLQRWEGRGLWIPRIWNPSIRMFHDIPPSPEIETSPDIKLREHIIGLGYDPLAKGYKFVKIVHGNRNEPPLVAVYTLGVGLWKIIPFQVKEGGSNSVWDFDSICETVYQQGSIYFLASHQEDKALELVSFDVSSEVFCSIDLPGDYYDWFGHPGNEGYATLVHHRCSSLALIQNSFDSLTMWVLESKSMCWTEAYELDLAAPELLYVKKNRDILTFWSDEEAHFRLAIPKGVELSVSLVSLCNLDTKEEKILTIQKNEGVGVQIPNVYGYTESLVLLK